MKAVVLITAGLACAVRAMDVHLDEDNRVNFAGKLAEFNAELTGTTLLIITNALNIFRTSAQWEGTMAIPGVFVPFCGASPGTLWWF